MKILISGSSGFIGSSLAAYLQRQGDDIWRLSRFGTQAQNQILWNPAQKIIDKESLNGFDAIINLAGENLFGRWTKTKKQRIYHSRIDSTTLLVETIAQLEHKPAVFLCASAIGYYGNRGDEILTENSVPGHGFLADVCRDWESAAMKAQEAGVRTACLRFGMVLDKSGGALAKMLPVFKLALGGPLADGKHWQSWISLTDAARAIDFILRTKSLAGPVNIVSPAPLTNKEFTQKLAASLHRPALLPAPAFALKVIMGEFAEAVLLSSTRVLPEKLINNGFEFCDSKWNDLPDFTTT